MLMEISESMEDPYPRYEQLRRLGSVPYDRASGNYWILRHDNAMLALTNRRFGKAPLRAGGAISNLQNLPWLARLILRLRGVSQKTIAPITSTMLTSDPPDHTRLRSLVQRAFTPRTVDGLRPRIEQIANDLLDRMTAGREADFVADFAFPLPATVIAELIGVPGQDRSRFRHWSQQLIMGLDSTQPNRVRAAAGVAVTQLLEYFRKLVTVRRGHPADDLITALMAAEEAHDRLSVEELLGTCQLLLVAGHETTTNLIGTGFLRLIRHPDALEQQRSTPALLPSAIEELLRFESPVQQVRRVTLEDIEIGNTRIPHGQLVIVCLAAANRDPEVFDDPNHLNLEREPNPHLAFGHGIHFCLGASLARLETQIAFGCVLQRLTDIQLAGEPVWSSNKVIRGLRSLPIRYTMHH
jgi:pimeloyl-[acyl-carrier protein] synthase